MKYGKLGDTKEIIINLRPKNRTYNGIYKTRQTDMQNTTQEVKITSFNDK